MSESKIEVVICGNKDECMFYLQQFDLKYPGYHISRSYLEAANDEKRILFCTPDDVSNLKGMHISRYDVVGTTYKHRKFSDTLDMVKSLLR